MNTKQSDEIEKFKELAVDFDTQHDGSGHRAEKTFTFNEADIDNFFTTLRSQEAKRVEEAVKMCAEIASQFTVKEDRKIHPDIKWEDMNKTSQLASHTTAQQIALAIYDTLLPKEDDLQALTDKKDV